MSDFKNVITKLRKEQDLNQQEFADKLGVSKSTVSMWEIGERFPSKELYYSIRKSLQDFSCRLSFNKMGSS